MEEERGKQYGMVSEQRVEGEEKRRMEGMRGEQIRRKNMRKKSMKGFVRRDVRARKRDEGKV